MDKIKAFEGNRDATFYRELLHEMAVDVYARYFHRNLSKGVGYGDEENIFYKNEREASKIAQDVYYYETIEEFNEVIERLEELEKPLLEEAREAFRKYMKQREKESETE